MKLENQVCALEQGEKLLKLGVSNDSFFHWFMDDDLIMGEHWSCGRLANPNEETIPAFTVAELGVMLPTGYDSMRVTERGAEMWRTYDESGNDFPNIFVTEAEARAAVLIHLLDTNIISPEEVNQRLAR